jgi:hypothetical protein
MEGGEVSQKHKKEEGRRKESFRNYLRVPVQVVVSVRSSLRRADPGVVSSRLKYVGSVCWFALLVGKVHALGVIRLWFSCKGFRPVFSVY